MAIDGAVAVTTLVTTAAVVSQFNMINEHCLTGIQNDSNSFTNDCVSLLHKHHLCFLGTSSSELVRLAC